MNSMHLRSFVVSFCVTFAATMDSSCSASFNGEQSNTTSPQISCGTYVHWNLHTLFPAGDHLTPPCSYADHGCVSIIQGRIHIRQHFLPL